MASSLCVRLADLAVAADQQAVLELLDMYARDPLGAGKPLPDEVRQRLIPDLQQQPGCRALVAYQAIVPVGLAICFLGYSSFEARPLLNIHDLAVVPALRGRGVGRALLNAAESEARLCGCCRVTLEVRADNAIARRLYQDFGFDPGDPQTSALSFWKKNLT